MELGALQGRVVLAFVAFPQLARLAGTLSQ